MKKIRSRCCDDAAGAPEAVARLFVLKPPSPLHRAGETNHIRVPSAARCFLLSVEVPVGGVDSNRFSARILDAAGNEIWKDEEADVVAAGLVTAAWIAEAGDDTQLGCPR